VSILTEVGDGTGLYLTGGTVLTKVVWTGHVSPSRGEAGQPAQRGVEDRLGPRQPAAWGLARLEGPGAVPKTAPRGPPLPA